MQSEARIEQAVHGYSDGHGLLAASRSFSRKVERTMLLMSDLSGAAITDGFHSYLTGYPLPGEDAYALARTWYAPEMDRPGCVWTHTLVLSSHELRQIRDPRGLARIFMRPSKGGTFEAYQSPIPMSVLSGEGGIGHGGMSQSQIPAILSETYGTPDLPIFVLADRSEEYDDLVLALWTQQWPELRGSFSFCTGSIESRELSGRPLDLQIIPNTAFQKVKQKVPKARFIEGPQSIQLSDSPQWLEAAIQDFSRLPDGELTGFLRSYGEDISEGRVAFAKLSDIFAMSRSPTQGQSGAQWVINAIARNFPKKGEALVLKRALVEDRGANDPEVVPNVSCEMLLRELLTTQDYHAFDPKGLELGSRAKKSWDSNVESAAAFAVELADLRLNPLGEEYLIGSAQGAASDEAVKRLKKDPALIQVFLTHNPLLATFHPIWEVPTDLQLQMLSVLEASQDLAPRTARRIVTAIFATGDDVLAARTVAHFGNIAVDAVLGWMNSSQINSTEPISEGWKQALIPRSSDLLRWLLSVKKPRVGTLATLASLLDPNSSEVLSIGLEPWHALKGRLPRKLSIRIQNEAMAFLLAIGFHNPDPTAPEFVAHSFERVYQAVEEDKLPYRSWRKLNNLLPKLSWWRDWDRRERLVRGLVMYFIEYDWPVEEFVIASRHAAVFAQIVDLSYSDRKVRRFIKKVALQVSDRGIQVNAHQQTALMRVL